MSRFDWEPYKYFSCHAAAIVGKPGARKENALQKAGESLRFELALSQIERHCDEIARIMAPDGYCFAAFELFQFDKNIGRWFLVKETHKALEILAQRFTFDYEVPAPDEAALRIEINGAPSVVQSFVLRHK